MSNSLPKTREDLRVAKQEASGQTFYIISDPVTGKYIRLREPEYVIFESLDGQATAEEIAGILQNRLNIQVPPEAVEKFAAKFDDMLFLDTPRIEYVLSQKSEEDKKKSRRKSILHLRFETFNPEQLLDRLYKKLRFAFSPHFVIAASLLILLGIWVLFSLPGRIPYSAVDLLQVSTIASLIAALFVVIVLHEFAHALVCHHFGGRVREMGFLLIYFQPAFYCNLSDSYMFPKKSQKIYTILAGMYMQVLIGAVSVVLWRIIKQGTLVSDFLFVVALVSFGTLIFNLNPLLKLDGYYFLTDLVNIPNLRQKAFAYLKRLFVKIAFGISSDTQPHSRRERRIFVVYSILAVTYSVLLLYFLGSKLMNALVEKWQGAGFLLFAALLLIIFKPLLMSTARQVKEAVREDAISRVSRTRWFIWGGLLVVLVLVLVLVKTEQRVSSSARLRPIESFTIRAPEKNVLESIYFLGGKHQTQNTGVCQLATLDFSVFKLEPLFQEGETVNKGDTLLTVSSNLYKGDLAQIESELKKASAEYNLLLSDPKAADIARAKNEVTEAQLKHIDKVNEFNRADKMLNGGLIPKEEWERARTAMSIAEAQVDIAKSKYELLISGPKAEELLVVDAEIGRLEARKNYLLEQIEASTFIAPFVGRVSSNGGADEILTMVRTDTLEAVIAVPEEDYDIIATGLRSVLKVSSYPTKSIDGMVVRVNETATAGAQENIFTAISVIPNDDGLLKPGMTGYVKVYCGKMSLGGKLLRRVFRFFRVEFWSWW
ncbi:MAG: HlyD family efflux transporter periplasmic adaptor subunit [Candidatus Zixiibacteriota bacterium]